MSSSAPVNRASWLKTPKGRLEIDEAPHEKPAKGEVVIKVHAVSIQPVDWKVQAYDFFIKSYPTILGTDVAGEIYEVGEGVTTVKKGDRVLGHAIFLATQQTKHSAFQLYTHAPAIAVSTIPSALSFEEASVLPLALSTAASGLYQSSYLGLPLPKANAPNPEGKGKVLLVWGGSSSVGATAIQLAVASGLRVVSTASPANFDFVKSLGVSAVVDYKDSQVVEKLVAELEKEGEEFAGVYDAISEGGSVEKSAEIATKVKGGKRFIATTLPPPEKLPAEVKTAGVFAPDIVTKGDGSIAKSIFLDFVPAALQNGSFKAKPDVLLAGKGLEDLEKGLEVQKKGVSAKKVVVSIV
ncbi:hypothetical protein JCM11641_005231 [Rhodosporidiobolus odoratus]